ncbi:hypothetical protein [Pseudoalteromonas sp. Of11M-6]|uniref:hypothetical protein n=1 Tax=Pseudoalteromonas sp. Of11M-6 TaxID=2917754 RepID=UPI001EF6DD20|nr:hypothetical protein [Pseudoalteromonas sp. Of11M-6]MCG7556336.1 hypothetical protein [Pseudoalteromonas sp. Of11M-6]
MDRDKLKKFNGRLSVNAIDRCIQTIHKTAPKTSAITISIIMDIVRHQGDSPANIGDRLFDNRDSSTVHGVIKKLEKMNWIRLDEVQYQHGAYPRKQVYLTSLLAELLELTSEEIIVSQ